MSPPMIYGYIPQPDFLLQRAKDKNLTEIAPTEAFEEVMAMEKAIYDIIKEAGLRRIARMDFVDVEGDCMIAIALGNNYGVLGVHVKVTRDGIERVKKILGTTHEPFWLRLDE
ncbi:unnamed protein product [Somion occarium]|uniref:Uncharacterized protein n=2 Tax=Somion occarium TaxID=3059160 RepID=A0ABP1DR64_9APHY